MNRNRIVTIHAVSENTYTPYRLEKYIKAMQALGYSFVSINNILKNIDDAKQIALTFDDCYQSTFLNAVPILKKYDVPALMFIPTGLLGYSANNPTLIYHECYKDEATMTIDEVNHWIAEGFDIGFHTHEHIDMYDASDEKIEGDFNKGVQEMRNHGWITPYFAYPKGFLPKNRAMFEKLLLQNGFKYAFTINHGNVNIKQPLYINRVCLGNTEPFIWGIAKSIGYFSDWYFRKNKQHLQQMI